MSVVTKVIQVHQFFWQLEVAHHQRLAWMDAQEARMARARAEQQAAEQLRAMLIANPSGQLGTSALNDRKALRDGGFV